MYRLTNYGVASSLDALAVGVPNMPPWLDWASSMAAQAAKKGSILVIYMTERSRDTWSDALQQKDSDATIERLWCHTRYDGFVVLGVTGRSTRSPFRLGRDLSFPVSKRIKT